MPAPPFCHWLPGQFLEPRVVRMMNAEALGGYVSLLLESWMDPDGSVPDDPDELPRIARMTPGQWARHEKAIRSLFTSEGGRLRSEIVTASLEKAGRKRKQATEAAEARWQEHRKGEPETHAAAEPEQSGGNAKENRTEENKGKTPASGKPEATGRKKAIQKGDPENQETWDRFDAIYPRPGNGRKLERADARLTWDLIADDGEDMEKVIQGAQAYREWIDTLKKREYVCMMTTWLNQRRWEESYYIDPSSEDGKRVAAEKEAEDRERRSAHLAEFKPAYEAYVDGLARAGVQDEEFRSAWRTETEKVLEKRKAIGMTGAVRMVERLLNDPAEAEADMIRRWRESNASLIPDFWTWDAEQNPKRLEA